MYAKTMIGGTIKPVHNQHQWMLACWPLESVTVKNDDMWYICSIKIHWHVKSLTLAMWLCATWLFFFTLHGTTCAANTGISHSIVFCVNWVGFCGPGMLYSHFNLFGPGNYVNTCSLQYPIRTQTLPVFRIPCFKGTHAEGECRLWSQGSEPLMNSYYWANQGQSVDMLRSTKCN